MSTSLTRKPSSELGDAASAFPILMRVPDLRRNAEAFRDEELGTGKTGNREQGTGNGEADSVQSVSEGPQEFVALQCPAVAETPAVELPQAEQVSAEPPQSEPPRAEPPVATTAGENAAATLLPVAADKQEPPPAPPEPKASRLKSLTSHPLAAKLIDKVLQATRPKPAGLKMPAEASTESEGSEPEKVTPAHTLSPLELRRQRARERQRQQMAELPAKSWWTSHVPVIAVGFLLALALTIYMARSNREVNEPSSPGFADIPELAINNGSTSSDSPSPSHALSHAAAMAASMPEENSPVPTLGKSPLDAGTGGKLPALLAAKPQTPSVEAPDAVAAAPERASETPNVEAPAASTAQDSANYPSTAPTAFRAGGRMPQGSRESMPANTPRYPTTSAPNTWR